MEIALFGAICSILLLSKVHDKQLKNVKDYWFKFYD
jgi:putative membrane protein